MLRVNRPSTRSETEPVAAKAELEHRDVPAYGADAELALSEKRPTACSERTPRRAADAPRRGHASCPLERDQGVGGELAADAVDRTRIEPVGTKPDLESGDASTGREPAGSEREDANGHRDADDGEATHDGLNSAAAFAILPTGRARGRGYNPAAAFPGSSIGRASGC